MKIKKPLLLLICIVAILIILYGVYTKPDPIKLSGLDNSNGSYSESTNNLPVGKYSKVSNIDEEVYGRVRINPNVTYNEVINSDEPLPTIVPTITPDPLPYPRIMINYTVTNTDNIQDQIAEKGYDFTIITLEIKNYGYKYFDVYPTKFKIISSREEFKPWINVSTGNSLDAVLPDNSMTIGNLIIYRSDNSRKPQLEYTDKGYTIIYHEVTDRILGQGDNTVDDIGD